MGGAWKIAMTLLAAACAAAVLVACGGGGDSSTSSTTGSTQPTTTSGGGGGGGKESQQGGGGKENENGNSSPEEGGAEGESDTSGERSSSFRTPGGDNSIQEYGSEAAAEERAKATQTISGFYTASANQEWAKVCTLISAKNKSQLKLFSEKMPKLKGKGCTGVLALVTPKTQSKPPETIKGPVVSLRREGSLGFALYHGVDGKNYAYPLKLEAGEWKLTALAPTPLSF